MDKPQVPRFLPTIEEVNARLVPVILGADILCYSYVRQLHEVFDLAHKPIVLTSEDIKFMTESRHCTCCVLDEMADTETQLALLRALGEELAADGLVGLLLGSGDWYARTLSQHKRELSRWYHVPYIDFDLLDYLTMKDNFYALCDEHGLDHPKTLRLDCARDGERWDGDMHGIGFPCIAKPSNSAAWHYADFEGAMKIHQPQDYEELSRLYATVRDETSYDRYLLVQDRIPGNDDSLLSLTAFIGRSGRAVVSVLGQVVLQDHTPQALGNPVCIVSAMDSPCFEGRQEELRELADRAVGMLASLGYRGYANCDIMYDRRDGSLNLLEVNTRPGRNTYYVTLAGAPFVEPIVRETVMGETIQEPYEVGEFCFTCVPPTVVREQVRDPRLRDYVLDCYRRGIARNPLYCDDDSLTQRFWAKVSTIHQITKFRKWMPPAE